MGGLGLGPTSIARPPANPPSQAPRVPHQNAPTRPARPSTPRTALPHHHARRRRTEDFPRPNRPAESNTKRSTCQSERVWLVPRSALKSPRDPTPEASAGPRSAGDPSGDSNAAGSIGPSFERKQRVNSEQPVESLESDKFEKVFRTPTAPTHARNLWNQPSGTPNSAWKPVSRSASSSKAACFDLGSSRKDMGNEQAKGKSGEKVQKMALPTSLAE